MLEGNVNNDNFINLEVFNTLYKNLSIKYEISCYGWGSRIHIHVLDIQKCKVISLISISMFLSVSLSMHHGSRSKNGGINNQLISNPWAYKKAAITIYNIGKLIHLYMDLASQKFCYPFIRLLYFAFNEKRMCALFLFDSYSFS